MSIKKQIDDLRSQIGTYNARIRELQSRVCDLYLKEEGLEVGDRVLVNVRGNIKEAEVTGATPYGSIKIAWVKKDGTVSQKSAGCLWDGSWAKKDTSPTD